jgi:hypothetical protein
MRKITLSASGLIKLPGPHIINIAAVNQVRFDPSSRIAIITWSSGDSPTRLSGPVACAFMDAIEACEPIDVSFMPEETELTKDWLYEQEIPY